jgi:hypothetical protein
MELVSLFARRTKDPQLRLLLAGLKSVTGPRAVVIENEVEEREGG